MTTYEVTEKFYTYATVTIEAENQEEVYSKLTQDSLGIETVDWSYDTDYDDSITLTIKEKVPVEPYVSEFGPQS